MSDKAKYAWVQVIVVVMGLHWAWGYFWLMGIWLAPLTTAVIAPLVAYPPLAVIVAVVTVLVPSFFLAIPFALLAMLTYKCFGIWHLWSDTSSLQKVD